MSYVSNSTLNCYLFSFICARTTWVILINCHESTRFLHEIWYQISCFGTSLYNYWLPIINVTFSVTSRYGYHNLDLLFHTLHTKGFIYGLMADENIVFCHSVTNSSMVVIFFFLLKPFTKSEAITTLWKKQT